MVSSRAGKTVGVPRGLLRFLVLKMISQKPMSGVEISEQIEKETGGRWKPSSGSIYPLLAWMHNKGFTEELPREGDDLRRYTFTVEGSKFFEKQILIGQDFLNRMEFLLPMLIGEFQFGSGKEKIRASIDPARQLVSAFMYIRHNLEGLSERDIDEIVKALTECSEKLEKVAKKLKRERET